jgi:hypothetical protein
VVDRRRPDDGYSRVSGAALITMAVAAVMVLGLSALSACSVSPLVSTSASDRSTDELDKIIHGGDAQAAEEAAAVLVVRKDPAAVPCLAALLREQSAPLATWLFRRSKPPDPREALPTSRSWSMNRPTAPAGS